MSGFSEGELIVGLILFMIVFGLMADTIRMNLKNRRDQKNLDAILDRWYEEERKARHERD